MDNQLIDRLARRLAAALSRRHVAALLLSTGVAPLLRFAPVATGKKKKRNKPKKNEFGCLDVGKKCNGKNNKCCSGICNGKRPKKKKKDKSKCAAHDTGACTPERDFCVAGQISASCGTNGLCVETTGNASFCASGQGISQELNCRVCSTDKDCEAQGFPLGSACVIFTGGTFCFGVSDCAGVNGSTGTACFAPGA